MTQVCAARGGAYDSSNQSVPRHRRVPPDFRVNVQIPWNAPEAVVILDSPGLFVLDTTYVPDVSGLRTQYPDAEPVKVIQVRAQECVCVLIPDAKVTDRGFHDVTLADMARMRRQWHTSVVSGMSQKQLDLEVMRHNCKWRFYGARTGCCGYCGKNIKKDMVQHVSAFHWDLAQL